MCTLPSLAQSLILVEFFDKENKESKIKWTCEARDGGLWVVLALVRLRQEDCLEFKAGIDYIKQK